jgi:hypothetical protein
VVPLTTGSLEEVEVTSAAKVEPPISERLRWCNVLMALADLLLSFGTISCSDTGNSRASRCPTELKSSKGSGFEGRRTTAYQACSEDETPSSICGRSSQPRLSCSGRLPVR